MHLCVQKLILIRCDVIRYDREETKCRTNSSMYFLGHGRIPTAVQILGGRNVYYFKKVQIYQNTITVFYDTTLDIASYAKFITHCVREGSTLYSRSF